MIRFAMGSINPMDQIASEYMTSEWFASPNLVLETKRDERGRFDLHSRLLWSNGSGGHEQFSFIE